MYFSFSTITLYTALISQFSFGFSAPVFPRLDRTKTLSQRSLSHRSPFAPSTDDSILKRQVSATSTSLKATQTSVKGTNTSLNGVVAAHGTDTSQNGTKSGGNTGGNSPRFVIYTDQAVKSATGLPDPSQLKGYTHLLLGFLLPTGPADQSKVWSSLSDTQRKALKAQYAAAGIKVMVSAFGGTSQPTTDGNDPAQVAQSMASFVKANDFDGIDVDYEDLKAVSVGTAAAWLITFMTTLRQTLPTGQFLVSHAPLAPHMSPVFPGASSPSSAQGPYLQVDKKVGNLIDFYNLQFYNDGATVYTDCNGLLTKSSSLFPLSSLFEIASHGVPLNKLVIGKPITSADATNGQITPALLGQCVEQATKQGWNAGIMGFEFRDAAGAAGFIQPALTALSGGSLVAGGTETLTVTTTVGASATAAVGGSETVTVTTTVGGSATAVVGGSATAVVGGSATAVVGGSATAVVGGSATAVAGGSATDTATATALVGGSATDSSTARNAVAVSASATALVKGSATHTVNATASPVVKRDKHRRMLRLNRHSLW